MRIVSNGDSWIARDAEGRYRWGGEGASLLGFKDADDDALIPTIWHAEDLLGESGNTLPGDGCDLAPRQV